MKDTVQTGLLLLLVIILALFFGTTKGNDELNLDFNVDFSTEEEFSYPVVTSSYNGEYRSNKGNGIYAMVGENPDGTFRVYFIHQVASTKNIILKLDSATMENEKIKFKNTEGVSLTMEFSDGGFTIPSEIGYGDVQLEGFYSKMKDINTFSMSEFEIFKF